MKGLTRRQQEIIHFIEEYIDTNQLSPSYREIRDHFGFSSLGSVYKHLNVLKRKGVLFAEKNASRSLTLASKSDGAPISNVEIELPFIGHISAGTLIETFPQTQTLAVPDYLVTAPDSTYVLRARGDTLHDELISDGDLLLVEARQEAYPGETIVALIEEKTIVKRYYPEDDSVRLVSSNPNLEAMIMKVNEIQIQGVVVGLMRVF